MLRSANGILGCGLNALDQEADSLTLKLTGQHSSILSIRLSDMVLS